MRFEIGLGKKFQIPQGATPNVKHQDGNMFVAKPIGEGGEVFELVSVDARWGERHVYINVPLEVGPGDWVEFLDDLSKGVIHTRMCEPPTDPEELASIASLQNGVLPVSEGEPPQEHPPAVQAIVDRANSGDTLAPLYER